MGTDMADQDKEGVDVAGAMAEQDNRSSMRNILQLPWVGIMVDSKMAPEAADRMARHFD